MSCYGIPELPSEEDEGLWLCRACRKPGTHIQVHMPSGRTRHGTEQQAAVIQSTRPNGMSTLKMTVTNELKKDVDLDKKRWHAETEPTTVSTICAAVVTSTAELTASDMFDKPPKNLARPWHR